MMQSAPTGTLTLGVGSEFDDAPPKHVRVAHAKAETPAPASLDLGSFAEVLNSELSWTLALSTPLAVAGATFLAHSATWSSDVCSVLAGVCLVTIFVLQWRVRRNVRAQIVDYALTQGFSEKAGRQFASSYLKRWFQ